MLLALANGRLIDARGGMIPRGTLLCENGTIVAAGADVGIPDGAKVIDCAGKTVMPGLIDVHVHLVSGDVLDLSDYASSRRLGESQALAGFRTYDAGMTVLKAGFTTVRTVGDRDFIDVAYRQAVKEGLIVGPRLIASGPGITMTGGHVWRRCVQVDGEDEIRKEVRRQWREGVDCIKIMGVTGGVSTPGSDPRMAHFLPEEVMAAASEAQRLGLLTATHCHAVAGIWNAIHAGVTTIGHGHFLDEEAAYAMAEKGIYLVPTLANDWHKREQSKNGKTPASYTKRVQELKGMGIEMPHFTTKMAHARKAGVKVLLGTDCGGNPLSKFGTNAVELLMLEECGWSPMEAIMAGTSLAAEAMGLSNVTGSLRPGLAADLLIVDGNPLENLRILTHLESRIAAVIKDGQIVAS
jgi:imidazolonepropionase-like amidohydrolase